MLLRRKFQFLTSDTAILIMLWIAAFVCDRLWTTLDNSPPAWDTGDHLTSAAKYWGMLNHPQFFSGDWWTKLWQLSPSFRAPFVYLMTAPFFTLFGCSYDSGTLVNLLFTAVILVFVYQLGKHIFSAKVGLWAAGLSIKSELRLYQRRISPMVVEKLNSTAPPQVSLGVLTSLQAPPGKPIPVQYEFTGSWEQLQDGLVLLTWQGEGNQRWLHDHAIALGQLYTKTEVSQTNTAFRVIENLAMLPPAELPAGTYSLKATYLNRRTGNTYPLATPPIQIILNPQAANIPAPELDLITQLEQLATGLPEGKLDPIFRAIARINQYDPLQDYLNYAETALTYRLSQEPKNLDFAYSLVLSQLLQRRVEPLLKTLNKITQQDAKNAYAWTYLGFVHLYNFEPKAAESALQVAEKLNSKIPEVKTLRIVSSAMQFNFLQAWERYKAAK